MHSITIGNQKFTGPSAWNELTARGLLLYAKVIRLKTLDQLQAAHQLVMALFGLPFRLFKKLPESRRILLHECIDWLYEQNTIKQWLLKSVTVDGLKLYGPQNALSDLTGEEFMHCELLFEQWLESGDDAHMTSLFAVIYRPKGNFSNKRLPFNPERLQKREKQAAKVKDVVKHAVMINYAGCRNNIIALHPHIWKQAYQGAETGTKFTGWASIFLDLAGDKFGTYQQTIQTNVLLLLADLDKKAKNAAEMEANR